MGMVGDRNAHFPGLAGEAVRRGIVDAIVRLTEVFRLAGLPVAHSTFVPKADYSGTGSNCRLLGQIRKQGRIREGDPSAEIHPKLTPDPRDLVTRRIHALSAFHGTELDGFLRNHGVQTIVLVGVSTNLALPNSAAEAVNHGFQVVIPEDCTAGAWPEAHEFMVEHTLPLLASMTACAEVIDAVTASQREGPSD
jgi:nicotinamidase-related amidase